MTNTLILQLVNKINDKFAQITESENKYLTETVGLHRWHKINDHKFSMCKNVEHTSLDNYHTKKCWFLHLFEIKESPFKTQLIKSLEQKQLKHHRREQPREQFNVHSRNQPRDYSRNQSLDNTRNQSNEHPRQYLKHKENHIIRLPQLGDVIPKLCPTWGQNKSYNPITVIVPQQFNSNILSNSFNYYDCKHNDNDANSEYESTSSHSEINFTKTVKYIDKIYFEDQVCYNRNPDALYDNKDFDTYKITKTFKITSYLIDDICVNKTCNLVKKENIIDYYSEHIKGTGINPPPIITQYGYDRIAELYL